MAEHKLAVMFLILGIPPPEFDYFCFHPMLGVESNLCKQPLSEDFIDSRRRIDGCKQSTVAFLDH